MKPVKTGLQEGGYPGDPQQGEAILDERRRAEEELSASD